MSTTTETTIAITCPGWGTVTAEKHANELWDLDGDCDHRTDPMQVTDPAGYHDALTEPRACPEIEVQMGALMAPDGRPTATPLIWIEERKHTLEQAEAFIKTLTDLIAACRKG